MKREQDGQDRLESQLHGVYNPVQGSIHRIINKSVKDMISDGDTCFLGKQNKGGAREGVGGLPEAM